jgi:hypothetical protein
MGMNMQSIIKDIVYTNSEYFDVLEIFLEEQERYGIDKDEICILANKKFNEKNQHIIYDDSLIYSERLIQCLEKINSEYIFYQHEDMFLYSKPDFKKINDYINFLSNSKYSFIRLCRTGNLKVQKIKEIDCLYEITNGSSDFFAVQPTIWKKQKFIDFLKLFPKSSIWELEIKSQEISQKNVIQGLIHFDNENKRGGHYDSNIGPYIATAIVKGKWNFSEYKIELEKIKKISNSLRDKI